MNAGMDSKLTSKKHDIPSTQSVPIFGRPRAFDTIVWGGLVAGVLDSIDADVAFGLNGMNPIRVLQFIASGLLGLASFKGGLATAVACGFGSPDSMRRSFFRVLRSHSSRLLQTLLPRAETGKRTWPFSKARTALAENASFHLKCSCVWNSEVFRKLPSLTPIA
jgi:hypothetical protein